jgi:hypothetical protein
VPGSVLEPAVEMDTEPFPTRWPDAPPRQPCGYVIFWGGTYLMEPVFQTNAAFVRTGGGATRQTDFTNHLNFAPQAGIGFCTPSGWGFRMRWFNYFESGNFDGVAGPGETLSAATPLTLGAFNQAKAIQTSSNMRLDSWEWEGTCSVNQGAWSLLLGTGLRYAHISQDYAAFLTNTTGSLTAITAGHNFNGVGPTFSSDGRLPVGGGNLALYGKLRFSLLFGESREDYTGVPPGAPITNLSRSQTQVLPVGEMEVGAEYSKAWGPARLLVQAGFVGQIWWNGGNASNVDPLAASTASGTNFGFVGLALRAGLAY